VTEKTFFECCISSRIGQIWAQFGQIWALSQMSLCTHNPALSRYNYFSISEQFFSPDGPQVFRYTIYQVIWPSPGLSPGMHTLVASPFLELRIWFGLFDLVTNTSQTTFRTALHERRFMILFVRMINHDQMAQWRALLVVVSMLLLTAQSANAAPAYTPFKVFGNFSRRTDLCADAQRVARGEVCLSIQILQTFKIIPHTHTCTYTCTYSIRTLVCIHVF